MIEVLPVINCADKDIEAVHARLNSLIAFSPWVHLDISDGSFTFNKSWRDHEEWKRMAPPVNLEVHLMVEEPERIVQDWLDAGAKRVIFHIEALHAAAGRAYGRTPAGAIAELRAACAGHGAELALGSNPETTVEKIRAIDDSFSSFLVLAQSHPGLPGQPFLPLITEKIARLRKAYPSARIEIDGGINLETARRSREAGASAVTAGTHIFSAPDPRAAYEELRRV